MFSDHRNKMRNHNKKIRKLASMWKLNIILLNKEWAKEEITREFKGYFDIVENKDILKFMGYN